MSLKLHSFTIKTLLIISLMGSVVFFEPAYSQDLPADPDELFDIELSDDSLDIVLDDSLDMILNDSIDIVLDDSLDIILNDTTLFAEEFEEEVPWTLSSALSFRNRQVQNGVDLSGRQGLLSIGTELSHVGGFLCGFDAARRVGDSPGPQGWNARLGYQYSANDWLDLSAQFTRFGYPSDSINPVAGIPNMFSLSATAFSSGLMFDLTFDRMFGPESETINYLSATIMAMTQWGNLRITPIASVVGTRYTIATKRLLISRPGKLQTITGIAMTSLGCALAYELTKQWSLTATPMLLYTPQKGLSADDIQATFVFGIRHLLEF
ncbi:hypothetical protein EBV26_08705 [bacterium]|nr:hypothetical protein [bacterium]